MKDPKQLKNQNHKYEEITIDELADILSRTILFDWENKLITFLCMLSAFSYEDQFNVTFNAGSSSGKTYIVSECAKYFPEEDKAESSGASPTAFFYGKGVYDKKRDAKIVSLHRKILLFYELPNPLLQQKLRPILSHDHWENKHQFTNKSGKHGANKTEEVIIEGFPAAIFCSAALRLDTQESTRAILLSPEVSQEKIAAALKLQSKRGADKEDYTQYLLADPRREQLKERVMAIRDIYVMNIKLPNESAIRERFESLQPKLKERHSRDFQHLQQLIKSITLLNVWNRIQSDGSIVSTQDDIDQAFRLWGKIAIYQDLGVSPAALEFYKKYILPAWRQKRDLNTDNEMLADQGKLGLSRKELNLYYLNVEETTLPEHYLGKQILPQLEASGVITQGKPEVGDARSPHIFPVWIPDDQNNIGKGVVGSADEQIEDPFDK